jgi:hypothetical protein
MKNPIQGTKATAPLRDSLNRSPWRRGFILTALAWLALSAATRAVNPAPDGGYPNGNTAEGSNALFTLTTGKFNTAIGFEALLSNTTGDSNTAIGHEALSNNTGNFNTANGDQALVSNTSGNNNTATGYRALYYNTTGDYNTANGDNALFNNTDGGDNTANGDSALHNNTTGLFNTANGVAALYSNTTADRNTANGYRTLVSNTTGFFNTATGAEALDLNTTGNRNTANGGLALYFNTTGSYNTANGYQALYFNNTGIDNTAEGNFALYSNTTGSNNTAIGLNALYYTTGSSNIALGFAAGVNLTAGSNNIDIGNYGVAGESAKIRIGTKGTHKNTYIAGIYGVTVARGVGVITDANGHLGTVTSSARFKEQIKPMDKASEVILALQPVTFRYKSELDSEGIPQFGLVAEQVEEVNPDLVARDEEGKPYTVRYEAVNAMLLNEFLKEHRKVESQDKRVQELETTVAQLKSALKEQASQIQKLTRLRQVEVSRPASQLVVNNQ